MQSRVEQFHAQCQIKRCNFQDVTKCKESFAWWVTAYAASFASRRQREPWWQSSEWCEQQDGNEHWPDDRWGAAQGDGYQWSTWHWG